jgi:Peptidase_C39 like family
LIVFSVAVFQTTRAARTDAIVDQVVANRVRSLLAAQQSNLLNFVHVNSSFVGYNPIKVRFGEHAETSTRDARAPQNLRRKQPPLQSWTVKRWWPVVVIVIVLVLVGASAAVYVDWTWKRKLSPRGGRPFLTRVELPVPSFQQGDDKWRDDSLGGVPENGTIGGEGCAVAAAAMVFKFYGIDVDPQQLNWFLTATGGFTEQGWLYWDRAAWFAPDRVRHVYEDLPSYQLIDSNIAHGNPVIVRVRLGSGITHFVVIAGKDGFDYLVRDPGAGSAKGLYPLRELGSDIEALRFYQPIANTNSNVAVQR